MGQPNTKHFVIDKILFEKEEYRSLSDGAKLTYGILDDYIKVAIDNKWIDQDGIYIWISSEQLGYILNKSNNTVSKIKKELEEVGLLKQKRVGRSQPNKLYIAEPTE
ncbi:replication initiator protein A [Staphylococcus equorum]|uniref:Replication initiator A N-terminal domain-containing protein n=1 Tax=Staphylococcus equorum TaxID=246432 RepID=A0AAP7IFC8_9STAP|nr:replication initiator protein A [Staphylococcus equorum]OEK58905.1 hypothetical protein ASS94_00860 [Staphylococcus equorum]